MHKIDNFSWRRTPLFTPIHSPIVSSSPTHVVACWRTTGWVKRKRLPAPCSLLPYWTDALGPRYLAPPGNAMVHVLYHEP